MGWLFMHHCHMGGHKTAKAYLDAQFTYAHTGEDGSVRGLRVLASACPGNRVWYAAAQVLENDVPGEIFAIVCLVRWNPRSTDGHQFGLARGRPYGALDKRAVGPAAGTTAAHRGRGPGGGRRDRRGADQRPLGAGDPTGALGNPQADRERRSRPR